MENNNLQQKKDILEKLKSDLGQLEDSSKERGAKLNEMEKNIKRMEANINSEKNKDPKLETKKESQGFMNIWKKFRFNMVALWESFKLGEGFKKGFEEARKKSNNIKEKNPAEQKIQNNINEIPEEKNPESLKNKKPQKEKPLKITRNETAIAARVVSLIAEGYSKDISKKIADLEFVVDSGEKRLEHFKQYNPEQTEEILKKTQTLENNKTELSKLMSSRREETQNIDSKVTPIEINENISPSANEKTEDTQTESEVTDHSIVEENNPKTEQEQAPAEQEGYEVGSVVDLTGDEPVLIRVERDEIAKPKQTQEDKQETDTIKTEEKLDEENKPENKEKTVENYRQQQLEKVRRGKEIQDKINKEKGEPKKEPTKTEIKKIEDETKKVETIEEMLTKQLAEARTNYADGYKKFMADRKKNSSWFTNNITRKIFGSKVKKEDLPEELKKLEADYEKATVAFGQKLYENKKAELVAKKLSEKEVKEKLQQFKQTELFQKIIVEEAEKLSAQKAENLPPKERNIYQKAMGWYMKQNRFTKVALSVVLTSAVIAAFSSGTIAAGGGILAYAGTKYVRGLVGGAVGQAAAKLYETLIKDKTAIKKGHELEELSKDLGPTEEMSAKELSLYKEKYTNILETEQKRKRNRLIHKAAISVGFGGLASYGAGELVHQLTPDEFLSTSGNYQHITKPSESSIGVKGTMHNVNLFKPEEVNISSRGAIQTISDLKEKISHDYPDISKAPASVQDFMKTDSTQEAIKLGFYNPNSSAESAVMLKGSTLGFDQKGNLVLHDVKTGQSNILVNEQGTIDKYHGQMTDTDNSGNNGNATDNKYALPKQEGDIDTQGENPDMSDNPYKLPPQEGMDSNNTENLVNEKSINQQDTISNKGPIAQDLGKNPNVLNGNDQQNINTQSVVETGNDHSSLSMEQLTEVNKTYVNNISKIFPGEESKLLWGNVYFKNADAFIKLGENDVLEEYKPFIHYLHKLQDISGLKPISETVLTPVAEKTEDYIHRALEKIAQMGKLDQVKL